MIWWLDFFFIAIMTYAVITIGSVLLFFFGLLLYQITGRKQWFYNALKRFDDFIAQYIFFGKV
jgi:hypothetical protein